jgi:amino acid transporter
VAACDNKLSALVIDPIALACVVVLTLVMVFGVKESFWFNVATVVISVIAILLCIFMGK